MKLKHMKKGLLGSVALLAALGIAAVLSISGCSDSTTSNSNTSDASGYNLVEDGKLTMISNFYFPPFVYMDDQTGQQMGFDVDLYYAICDKLGLEPNILPTVQFDTIVPTIRQGGKADVALGAITITDDRLDEVNMSDPYMDSNQAIVVPASAGDITAEDLNVAGTQIAVQAGTTGEAWARENLPNATVVPLDDIIQCLTGVQTGLYTASVCDLPVAQYEIQVGYSDLKVTQEIATGEQYGVVISKDNPELTAAINKALQELEDDGTIDQLEQKWFGTTL